MTDYTSFYTDSTDFAYKYALLLSTLNTDLNTMTDYTDFLPAVNSTTEFAIKYAGLLDALNIDVAVSGGANTDDLPEYSSLSAAIAAGLSSGDVYYTSVSNHAEHIFDVVHNSPALNDNFGAGVALSSDGAVMAVGVRADSDVQSANGTVKLYSVSGDTPTLLATVKPVDAANSDNFGTSVALNSAGTLLAAGAIGDDDTGSASGSVYLFSVSGSTVTQIAKITDPAGSSNDIFGASVALSGDGSVIAVGAIGEDGAQNNSGAVILYSLSGSTATYLTKFFASSQQLNGSFGSAVALNSAGTLLAVGERASSTATSLAGKVILYSISGSTATELTAVVAPDAGSSDYFGSSVALSADGSIMAVGAENQEDAISNSGAVYLYSITGGTTINYLKTFKAYDKESSDNFGSSVALSGDGAVMAVGARNEDTATSNAGKVYYYHAYFGANEFKDLAFVP